MTVSPGSGAGYGPVGGARAQLRVSTADRDRAIEFLQKAYGEGRLTKDEYDRRLERALSAVSFADLDVLVTDLPGAGLAAGPMYQPMSQRTNSLAIASLCCGVGQLLIGILAGIPAIVLGHMARRQIRQTGEQGAGMALAGIILGWIGVGLTVLMVILFVAFVAAMSHSGGVGGP